MKRTPLKRKTPLKSGAASLKRSAPKKKAAPRSPIRESARGRQCNLRIPGVCNFNPETTVAAHVRIAGLCGTGIKPSDLFTIRACASCHDLLDARDKPKFISLTRAELDRYILEALCRTQAEYLEEGLVTIKGI